MTPCTCGPQTPSNAAIECANRRWYAATGEPTIEEKLEPKQERAA